VPTTGRASTAFHYALRSSHQLEELARGPLPLGLAASEPRRSMHRDLYLDTDDDSLRRRGIVLRLRLGATDEHLLALRIASANGTPPLRLDARVRAADLEGALAEHNAVTRRIRALTDPAHLVVRLDLEVERMTRDVDPDLFRRPRMELHYDSITVRRKGMIRSFQQLCGHLRRGAGAELERLASALERDHDLRRSSGDWREHADLLMRWLHTESRQARMLESDDTHRIVQVESDATPELLSPELSLVAFQRRVLTLAEDPRTPLRERLRFLGIVTSNLDELYMVRIPELRRAAARAAEEPPQPRDEDGFTADERLARVERDVEAILEAQARCAEICLRDAAREGARLVAWTSLTERERETLSARCRDEIYPALTPLAVTLSPGHPIPHLPHLGLFLAVVFRRERDGKPHMAEMELPDDTPRLLPVPGRTGDVIPLEDVLRANVHQLYPNAHVESAHLFRVTRAGDLALDEEGSDSLLSAVALATEQRTHNPAVRVEVERSMPIFVSELVLESLRREAIAKDEQATVVDEVQVVDGLLDLRCLAELPLPPRPELEYPPLPERASLDPAVSMLDAMSDRDLLLHHPFETFDTTVVRFLREAAADPDVTTVKITLYRVGRDSPVVEALLDAARAGKRVVALVELKARFDEEHNVSWARALERAGGNVVYGLVGYKVHAKVALVVRRVDGRLKRYVHIGTGNYNTRSGRQYTDLSLFSTRDALGDDVADLFNELTGSSRPPQGLSRGALVAPHQLLPAVLRLIEREVAHARAGRAAHITIKVNGLSDPEVVRALYRAASAGVPVDLVVRGICTLRPGVPGRSEGIRVVSVVGRFLEHSRIYRFANGGDGEYLMGSSDLRPRNLRRRVELLVPVHDADHRARLDRILQLYLDDPTGWHLTPTGQYVRGDTGRPGAQESLIAGADA
jgi:polyphosphate kinase